MTRAQPQLIATRKHGVMVSVGTRLPPAVLRAAKVQAAKTDRSLQAFLLAAVLAALPEGERTRALAASHP